MNILLYPLSLLYGAAILLRNKLFDTGLLKSKRFDIPVISVGNIAVGGTGKTPHIEYLIEILSGDFEIAVLSRGYKRKTKDFRYVKINDTSAQCGDEPLQIKRKYPKIIVAVNANRVRGIEKLQRDFPSLDLILLDDAFQHRQVVPSLNIVLIDRNRPFWNDSVLPAGRLRDYASSLYRADLILITKCPENILPEEQKIFTGKLQKYGKPVYFSMFEYGKETPVEQSSVNMGDTPEILALSGIANPEPFMQMLEKRYPSAIIRKLIFPDHHDFSEKDIFNILKKTDLKTIITTEKDSMRLIYYLCNEKYKQLADKLFYIPVKVKIINNQEFNLKIVEHVRKNKTDSGIYKE